MSSPAMAIAEELDEAECLRLISPGGVGRIGFTGEHGLTDQFIRITPVQLSGRRIRRPA
jgi:hypothetical protein